MKQRYIQTKFRTYASDTTLAKFNPILTSTQNVELEEEKPNVVIIEFPPNLQTAKKRTTINDFLIISLLGRGAYAKVVRAQMLTCDKEYAIKIIDKKFLDKINKQFEVHAEKTALMELNHPNIIKLYSTFQDTSKIYFVLEYCCNRDLGQLVYNFGILPTNMIKFYSAEIVSALEHMHNKGIFHRDLKLENIAISDKMHLKIIDFATMNIENKFFDKKTMKFIDYSENVILEKFNEGNSSSSSSDEEDEEERIKNQRTINLNYNFVGTANYVSPEVLMKNIKEIGPACDLWGLGIIIYTLFNGKTPFQGKTEKITFQNILNCEYSYDQFNKTPEDAKDLISKLLIKDPSMRLGRGKEGFEELKKHPFFADIDFDNLKNTDPPIDPRIFLSYRKYEGISASPTKKRGNCDDCNIRPVTKVNIRSSKFHHSSQNLKNINEIEENSKIQYQDNIALEGTNKFLNYLLDTMLFQMSSSISIVCKVKLFAKGKIEINELSFEHKRESLTLDEFCKVQVIDEYNFHIVTQTKKFLFKHPTLKVAKLWTDKIKEIINQRYSIDSKIQEDQNIVLIVNSCN